MKKTFCYCDRCGCETTASTHRTITYDKMTSASFRITIDLCEPCYDAFMNFINKGEKDE